MAIPLGRGQTTLITTLNGGLAAVRRSRPGPTPKTNSCSTSLLPTSILPRSNTERRFTGAENEQAIQQMFSSFRRERGRPEDLEAEALPDDDSDADSDDDNTTKDTTEDHIPRRRASYPREYKLAAIEYFQITWRKKKDGSIERLSVQRAARRLKIDRRSLRRWVRNMQKIIDQPKGSRRAPRQKGSKGREHEMEILLNKEFEDARAKGRKIDDRWLLRHAKKIYRELHPERVIRLENGTYKYLEFRFSHGWFNSFNSDSISLFELVQKEHKKLPKSFN